MYAKVKEKTKDILHNLEHNKDIIQNNILKEITISKQYLTTIIIN